MCINLLLAAFSAVVTAEKPVTIDFGPDGDGGYPAFEVKALDGAAEAAVHIVYATHPDGLGPKGDFWRETSARYLGPNVDLPILPANIDRYDDFTVKAGGKYRAPLCQGLVRYAKLSTATKGVKISVENFRLQNDGVHATEEPTGSFSCSDERLNGVWKASVRTCQLAAIPAREKPLAVKCAWTNVVLGPTYAYVSDGAKRDRLVWSGDLWWADLNYYYAFDPKIPYLKGAILMLAENQTPEGFVQACPYPERHGNLKAGEWGPFESDEFAAWLIPVVCNYRLYTGDEETVRRVLPSLKKLMAYLESHCREDGLFEQRMETSKNAGALRFGANSTDHRAYMDILLQACRRGMAELTGEKSYAERAAQVAPAVKKAYDIGDGMYRFSIEQRHRNYEATSLNYALGDPDGRAYPLRWRKQIWHAKFEALTVRALFDGGFGDEALKAIEAHNWFKILDPNWKGMRTTYECMYMNTKNWGDEAHPDTAIAGILSRYVLGVVPTKPGWAEFKFDPHPPKSVTWAKGSVPTPKGLIHVEWKREGDRIVERLTVPGGLVRTDAKELATSELEKAASDDYAKPVRPGGVDGQPFWNNHSEWFMYPPSFDFKSVAGAAKYRFEFVLDGHQRFSWEADVPTACLAPTWDKIPENGMVTVFCHAQDAQGAVKGLAGERTFWKTSRFRPGRKATAKRTPSEAAAMVYDYLFDFPSAKYFREHGKPDPAYRLNAYPAKMHASTILAMVTYAKLRPDRRDAALKFACTAADYLISISQPADAPLAYMPPTYQGVHYTSKQYAGQQMMLYPAAAASAYLTLYEAVKDEKYLVAARHIADTYLKLQGEDGTCYLKMWEKDGKNISPNRAFPIGICEFLEKLYQVTNEQKYRAAADRGFAFVERGPLRDWNWEGQFEDVVPTEKYMNLTKHPACSTALYLLKRFPGDKRRIAQAREILRWSEDQFVAWTNPCRPDGTGFRTTGKREGHFNGGGWDSGYKNWMCPSVMEQYYCYVPIDASAAKLINTYVALYRAEKNPLDLAKARALADSAIRIQEPNGRIRTFWTLEDSKSPDADWINCMAAIARALDSLGGFELTTEGR